MRKTGIFLFLMTATLTIGSCVNILAADQVVLKNGDRLSGTIVKSDAKTLLIKTESEGDVTIQWPAIDTITSTAPLHVGLTGGQMIVGPVTTDDGSFHVASKTTGVVTAPRDSVVTIRDDAEQAAYDAAQDRLQHPHLTDFWSGFFDTGLSLTSGNSATVSFTVDGKAVRATDRDKITIDGTSVYTRNDNTSPAQTIAKETKGDVRVDINVSPRFFGFGFTNFDSNALQNLNLQNVIGGGAGYHVIKSAKTTFDLLAGGDYNQEFFAAYSVSNATPPPATTLIPALTQRNGEITAGEEVDVKVSDRTTFAENFTVFPELSGPSGYRFTVTSSAATKIKNWLGWQVTFSDNFLSNPPISIKGNDLLLSTGLRVTFGKQ